MRIIPDIPPKAFTFSAIVVGYLLIDDTTANEQNALGNWLMLTAQVLCTNAFYKQVQMERGNIIENVNENKNYTTDETIDMLEKMIRALQSEVDELKNKYKNC